MCEECGCGNPSDTHTHDHGDGEHHHHHGGNHDHQHEKRRVALNVDVLEKNNRYARENRELFKKHGLFVVNLISSPGSGKTLLLERLAAVFGESMAVIEGDVQTRRDAERVIRAGSRAYQIETGGACHLDAHSVAHAVDHLDLTGVKLLVIENVGNLVCPATYDLGEHMKIGILSLPEGDDKVLKYPALFSRIGALVISKTDLAPYLEFDVQKAVNECRSLNREFRTIKVSAKTGDGVKELAELLKEGMARVGMQMAP
jgi:hydrogenase nickel incorporation protein HypB